MLSKRFISLVLFMCLFQSSAQAAVFPTQATLTVAESTVTNTSSVITLFAGCFGATNRYSALIKFGTSVAYTPPGGTKFVAFGAKTIMYSVNAGNSMILKSSDTAAALGGGSSAPTNLVTEYGGGGSNGVYPTSQASIDVPTGFTIPNGKYGTLDTLGQACSGGLFVYGYEQ